MLTRTGGLAALAAAVVISGSGIAAADASSPPPPTVNIAIDGHSVSMPSTVPAGAVTIQTTTTGEKRGEIALVKLQPGVTIAQAFALVQSHHQDPNALRGSASIVADALAPKGMTTIQTTLQPGDYAAIDLGPRGQPPSASFTVTANGSPAILPTPSATITDQDFRFTGAKAIRTGSLVRFVNAGYVAHMTVAAKVASVADAKRVIALLKAGDDARAEKLATGFADFMDTVSPGGEQQVRITAAPGVYVLACFMPTQDGREHTALGMERMLKIVR